MGESIVEAMLFYLLNAGLSKFNYQSSDSLAQFIVNFDSIFKQTGLNLVFQFFLMIYIDFLLIIIYIISISIQKSIKSFRLISHFETFFLYFIENTTFFCTVYTTIYMIRNRKIFMCYIEKQYSLIKGSLKVCLILQFHTMSHTAHKNQEDKKQFFDSQDVLDQKINILAKLIIQSKHFIAFTGAGISTACGIPDFRSGVNTVLKTGPGAWQKKAQKVPDKPNKNVVQMAKAIPSFTHMSLVALQEAGHLKYLVSQNTDGLHVRSGFNTKNFAQLHGNRCLQKCKKCQSQFLRDFRTRQATTVHDHKTSRKCEKCNGPLYDSIINFGQNLPEYELNRSFEQAQKADLCLAMGSSLTVTPAADIPKQVGKHGKLIIVNLQKTPLDKYAFLRINALCDQVMIKLAKKMELKVNQFILHRQIEFKTNKQNELVFRGVDQRGIPFTFFKQVSVAYDKENVYEKLKGEPFKINLSKHDKARIKFQFYKWMGEPDYELSLQQNKRGRFKISYDPKVTKWIKQEWIQSKQQK